MLREAHAHIPSHGRELAMLSLAACTSRDDLLSRVASRHEELHNTREGVGEWLIGTSVRANAWADHRWPNIEELDAISRSRPIVLMSFDHHCVVANTPALVAAEISDSTPDPVGGEICRDARTGVLTGLLLESAAKLVMGAIPPESAEMREAWVVAALEDLAEYGFSSVHDLLSPAWLGPVLAKLDDEDRLPLEVWLYPPVVEVELQAAAARGGSTESESGWERPRVRLAGGKIFADGTLNSLTAWMLKPFASAPAGRECGSALMGVSAIASAIERVSNLGLGLAVHAIGDGAVRAALDAAGIMRSGGFLDGGVPRVRIEHCEVIDEADVARFARLGVVASVQPCHLLTDIEVLKREVPDRLHRVLPLRELIDAGCSPGELLWFGSDTPIVRPHPEDSILAATMRGRGDGVMIAAEQRISMRECLAAFSP